MKARADSVPAAVELFLELRAAGERVDPRAFAAEHEALGEELPAALETLLALEEATWEPPPAPGLPERVGPFRVVRELGRGGMGVVVEALEEGLGRRVALKLLPPDALGSASARARFRREAQLASRLEHSGIATVYGAGVEGDQPWIAMRLVDGRTLGQAIADARAMNLGCVELVPGAPRGRHAVLATARCVAQVARALHYAHTQGVVHRDVKPSNVLVATDGTPVLLDFGLAIGEEGDAATLTRTGQTAGTPAYLAPELVSGERRRPDVASDVYALGVTLYEALALYRPFDGATPMALYLAIESAAASDVRARNRDVPRDLAIVVATAMERDPAQRYRSAAAFAADLEASAAGRPILARPVPVTGRLARWARREPRQALFAGLFAAALLASAVLAGTWWESRAEVQAAAALTREQELERALQSGFNSLATNWLPEGYEYFARARELEPQNAEAIAGQALVRMKERRLEEAVGLLDAAPPTAAFRALRALAAGVEPEVEQPEGWFATAPAIEMFVDGMRLARQADASPRHERQTIARLALARFEEAVKRSQRASMLYQVERCRAAVVAGDAAAIRSAAAALSVLWPDMERALFTAGSALYALDPREALPLLERTIELDPKWGAPHQVLGNARWSLGDLEGAERALRRAIVLDPRDADAFNTLGLVLQEQECFEDARTAYVGALRLRPMFETWANLGLLDLELGDEAAAAIELRIALELSPRERMLLDSLARILARLGEGREALAVAHSLTGFHTGDAAAWSLVASCNAALGEPAAALDAAEAGLALAPDDGELQRLADLAQRELEFER